MKYQAENAVSSFFYYMWNAWSKEECKAVFGDMYRHFWDKWSALADKSIFGAAERFFAELSENNQKLLVERAVTPVSYTHLDVYKRQPFLSINREQFRVARNNADLETVAEGVFIVLSTSMLGKLKRGMARFVKRSSRKLCLVFDESDEITLSLIHI